ncbi:hypothetical protein [Gimesia panareensis]|uniref:Secreted protein n=1 Tax=Gimesia panareensis TaxID=2527978 RepID=A0A517QBZ7_9PLAN|nr:hypothetical protein [Gimesia panareensis]QDT29119.1 hypothetical protein Enr10x_44680 [Gimesia panareensis]QDU51972.1 hypothetical protein Pan110_43420 [Gimesia panareensis]QDV19917.1 hypothetical protein Pan153_45860 [Gimesia panareensis]
MTRFLRSLLFVVCLTPFQFGCGSSAPMTPETDTDPAAELDPAVEAEAQKQAMKNNR